MITKKTMEFLIENSFRNDKNWFLDNKDKYNSCVLQPLSEMVFSLESTIKTIDELIITDAKIDKTISRIYRDVRFSKNKELYRDHIWLTFKRDKASYQTYPEFFFVAMPMYYIYGCGYYAATKESMEILRELVLENHPLFVNAQKVLKSSENLIIDGDSYKKTKFPEQSEDIREWLDRKNISVMVKSDNFSALFDDGYIDKIKQTFLNLAPVYRLFLYVEKLRAERAVKN